MAADAEASGRSTLRRVARVTGVYIVAAAGGWQAADVAFEALGLPPRAITLVVLGAIAMLPLVVVAAWATSPASIRRLSIARRRAIVSAAAVMAAMAALAVTILVFRTDGPSTELPADLALATIRETVFSGDVADAAALADRLAKRQDVPREVKVEAYRHVVRAAVRSGYPTEARSTLDRMLDLEPPLILMHPAVESAEVIALYSAARRARVAAPGSAIVIDSAVFSVGPLAVTGIDLEDLTTGGQQPASVEAVQIGIVSMVLTELSSGLTMVDRLALGSLVEVDADDHDPEEYYRIYDDILAGRRPGLRVETHTITGSFGVNGDRVLVTLWAMSLRSGAVVAHGIAEGSWPSDVYDTIMSAANALMSDLKDRAL